MADADDKNNLTLVGGMGQRLTAIGVPEAKHDDKIANAKVWWGRAFVCGIITLMFLVVAFLIVYQTKGSPSIPLYIALGAICGAPALATLFCASQADGEATKAFVQTVLSFRKQA